MAPIVRVTRGLHFSAAHRLHREDWSDERNEEVFGACSNSEWHGHNYEMDVTVEGPIDPETGFVIDLTELNAIASRSIVDDVDHRNLNTQVDWLRGINPTTENLAVAVWDRIADRLPEGVSLVRLVIRETARNSVEYVGPTPDNGK